MRSRNSSNPKRADRRRGGLLRMLTSEESGFTIIEVVVGAVLVASIAAGSAVALQATSTASGDQRRRSQAVEIAQQDQERMRGMSIKTLTALNQERWVNEAGTPIVEPYAGTRFKVTSVGTFYSNTGASACNSTGTGAAAYVRIMTFVDWDANRRSDVFQDALITPTVGGSLLTNVEDQDGADLSGVLVTATGPETESATTTAEGCTVFGAMSIGDYTVSLSKSGYVDANGNLSPNITSQATVSSSGTAFPIGSPLKIGESGIVSSWFKTTIGSTTYVDQRSPSVSWKDTGSGMTLGSKNRSNAPTGGKILPTELVNSTDTLFPFNTGSPGVYTNNYVIWAGNCDLAKPPAGANQSLATVGPNGWAIMNDSAGNQPRIKVPALILNVNYKPVSGATVPVTPAAIKLKHEGCNQEWWPEVRPGAPTSALGQLNYPGQPYAPDVANQRLDVCADYTPNGGANYYRTNALFPPKTRNDNFTAGTTATVLIDAANSWAQGRC